MRKLEGKVVGSQMKMGIVAARFNEFIVSKLVSGAEDALVRHGVDTDDVDIAWVPGVLRDSADRPENGKKRRSMTR